MNKFWILISIIVIVILLLTFRDNSYPTSMSSDNIAQLTFYGLWGLLLASGILGSGIKLTHFIRNGLIWGATFLLLIIGYNMRYDLQDFGHRATAGLIPGSPVTRYNEDGLTVTLERMQSGHFEARGQVNATNVSFMIDTGASNVVLSYEDARRIGIDVNKLLFTTLVSTANGKTEAAPVWLDTLKIGDIQRDNIAALVAQPGALDGNLLGMSFLDRLSGYSIRGDRMILVD